MSGMTWKKRSGQAMLKRPMNAFSEDNSDEEPTVTLACPVAKAPRASRVVPDSAQQAATLRERGAALAELGRFWEALTMLDQAAELTPSVAELHEMRAQALLAVHELWPALTAAARAVRLRPNWWEAHQTLGRTLLGLGEIGLARRSFSIAAHLRPDVRPLRTDDLLWSCVLLERARRRRDHQFTLGKFADAEDNFASGADTSASSSGRLTSSDKLTRAYKSTNKLPCSEGSSASSTSDQHPPQFSSCGGVISEEQSTRILTLLGLGGGAGAGACRNHTEWPPLAEDACAEEEEERWRQEGSDDEGGMEAMEVEQDYPLCRPSCRREWLR